MPAQLDKDFSACYKQKSYGNQCLWGCEMSTTAEHAYQSLRRMVVKGELAAGQRVSQLRVARQLGCSTVPVVEALRRLESEGVLVKEPRKMAP